jgi:hypothetical protein
VRGNVCIGNNPPILAVEESDFLSSRVFKDIPFAILDFSSSRHLNYVFKIVGGRDRVVYERDTASENTSDKCY